MNYTQTPAEPVNEPFLPLPEIYKKNGYEFKLKKRVDDVAIYGQYHEHRLLAYEVFEIRKQEAAESNGIKYQAKELTPSNEAWGKNAYTVYEFEHAERYMTLILQSIKEREEKRETT